jgi:predicted methyltransferase
MKESITRRLKINPTQIPDRLKILVDASFVYKLKPGGIIWLDHSGKGVSEAGCRSDMTKEKMASIAEANGLFVSAQSYRSPTDCISVLLKQ